MSGRPGVIGKSVRAPAADLAVLAGVLGFLVSLFPPHLVFTSTIPAGGDTPSHYAAFRYLVETLLPHGRLSGWWPGAYAGFPVLELYFPLPFLIMAALSVGVGLPVAFKLGTVLGVFGLPVAVYACLRLWRVRSPGPALGAVGTLCFLCSEATSIWGGNISSVLAGEFAYSLGLALAVWWMGTFARGLETDRWAGRNAVLLSLVALSHGYAFLFAVVWSLGLLLSDPYGGRRVGYVMRVYGVAALLMSWWLLPLAACLPWATAYDFVWTFASWTEVVPPILMPLAVAAVGVLMWSLWGMARRRPRDPAVRLVGLAAAAGSALYWLAPALGVVDIRFLPCVQVTLVLAAAMGLAQVVQRLRGAVLVPWMTLAAAVWWTGVQTQQIPAWVEWNYRGLEQKVQWPVLAQVTERLRGSFAEPRVAYEHAMRHDALGSVRIWESLPLLAGRSTLEHAYFQASPSAPFVFYLQSEISEQISCPFPRYGCATLDLTRAARHLELFNVRELIVISDRVKARLRGHPRYRPVASVPPYDLYELTGPHAYVTTLPYEPVLWTGGDWKQTAYAWFRNDAISDVHLVFQAGAFREDASRFRVAVDSLADVPHRPLPVEGEVVWERLTDDEVTFETTALHQPHLIKVSYHPNWRVEGAEGIYVVSPAFMLVYPTQPQVRVFFARSWPDMLGLGLSVFGLGLFCWRRPLQGIADWLTARLERRAHVWRLARLAVFVAVGSSLVLAWPVRRNTPAELFHKALHAKDQRRWSQAEALFRRLVMQAPQAGLTQHAQYHLGILAYLQERWEPAIREFTRLVTDYPDSRLLAESYYHIGLCEERLGHADRVRAAHEILQRDFADTPWARHAQERWSRSSGR